MIRDPRTMRLEDLRDDRRPGTSEVSPMACYLIALNADGIPGVMQCMGIEGVLVGRSQDCGLQLLGTGVSRAHAYIWADERGDAFLTDLGSTNGTRREGELIPPRTSAPLKDGDRLRFGGSQDVKFVRLDPDEERLQLALYERAVRDGLTGLHNRAYFLDRVAFLAEQGAARGLGLAFLMIDVDRFKAVNDSHGHDAGDAVLRAVGDVLRESTRPGDLVARYGGEEFLVALSVPSPDRATLVAERIRAKQAAREVVADSGARIRVTASIGIAFAPPGRPPTFGALIGIADACLYRAKEGGRDRVVCEAADR